MAIELSFRETFDRLVTILQKNNLGWIVAQVEEQIRLGKPIARRVKELQLTRRVTESLIDSEYEMKPGRAVEFRATLDYTDAEQLKLLLGAIHYAIVSTSALGEIAGQRFPGIVFVSEQDNHRFDVEELKQKDHTAAVSKLQRAITDLTAQVT